MENGKESSSAKTPRRVFRGFVIVATIIAIVLIGLVAILFFLNNKGSSGSTDYLWPILTNSDGTPYVESMVGLSKKTDGSTEVDVYTQSSTVIQAILIKSGTCEHPGDTIVDVSLTNASKEIRGDGVDIKKNVPIPTERFNNNVLILTISDARASSSATHCGVIHPVPTMTLD